MPRAFLITHRRYNGTEEFPMPERDYSPERVVRLADDYGGVGQPGSDGVSDCGSETSSECPEELYNLTKLAEVSLAAAAGTLIHPTKVLTYHHNGPLLSTRWDHKIIEKYSEDRVPAKVIIDNISPSINSSAQHFAPDRTNSRNPTSENHNDDNNNAANSNINNNNNNNENHKNGESNLGERIEGESRNFGSPNHQRHSPELLEPQTPKESLTSSSGSWEPEKILEISDNSCKKFQTASTASLVETTNQQRARSVVTLMPMKERTMSCDASTKSDDSDDDHECPDCGKKYSTSSNLARHRQTHRSLGDKKARRCPHCDKIYVSMPAFSMHVRTHNQGCKCHYCGKCFSRPWLLQGHIRTHTGEKPFKCTICNKAFADKSNLRAHVQTHSNTKPHICGRCGKAFALKSYLYKHEESSCMRSHNRVSSEKREASNSEESTETVSPLRNSSSAKVSPIIASPTSVIVTRSALGAQSAEASSSSTPSPMLNSVAPANFPTIIRHTKSEEIFESTEEPRDAEISPIKRLCREKVPEDDKSRNIDRNIPEDKSKDILSARMVIRTSVISPNPEHLFRLGATSKLAGVKNSTAPYVDFTDPARSSAFTRPTAISLNLGMA